MKTIEEWLPCPLEFEAEEHGCGACLFGAETTCGAYGNGGIYNHPRGTLATYDEIQKIRRRVTADLEKSSISQLLAVAGILNSSIKI
jgi:hypothetical protein